MINTIPPIKNKCLIRDESGNVRLIQRPLIKASKGILIKMLYAGICGTDIQILNGLRPDKAQILGHEGVGQIIMISKGCNSNFKTGDLVTFNPVDSSNPTEILGHSFDGVFQNFVWLPISKIKTGILVRLPKGVDPFLAALTEPIAVAVYACELAQLSLKKFASVAIVGAGPVGLIHGIVAKLLGAKKVFLISRSKPRLNIAIEKGFIDKKHAFIDEEAVAKKITYHNPNGIDAVFFCANRCHGIPGLTHSLDYISDRGLIDLVSAVPLDSSFNLFSGYDAMAIRASNFCGEPQQGTFLTIKKSCDKKFYLTGHRGAALHHFKKALKLLCNNSELFHPLITNLLSPGEAARALTEKKLGSDSSKTSLKTLISFTGNENVLCC